MIVRKRKLSNGVISVEREEIYGTSIKEAVALI